MRLTRALHLGTPLKVHNPRRSRSPPVDRTYAFAYVLTQHCSTSGVFNAPGEALAPHSRQALLIPLPVAIFFGGALVVLLLTLGYTDLQFGAAVFPVQLQRHERVALALDRDRKITELLLIQQQLACANGIGDDV